VNDVCRVVKFYTLQGVLLIRISTTPSKMGDGLIVESKCYNFTFIMLYLIHEMEVGYLVVDEMVNISKLLGHNCMFIISANLWC
jgi:hypothetical protein